MSELTDKLRSYDPTSGYSRWMREAADRISALEELIREATIESVRDRHWGF